MILYDRVDGLNIKYHILFTPFLPHLDRTRVERLKVRHALKVLWYLSLAPIVLHGSNHEDKGLPAHWPFQMRTLYYVIKWKEHETGWIMGSWYGYDWCSHSFGRMFRTMSSGAFHPANRVVNRRSTESRQSPLLLSNQQPKLTGTKKCFSRGCCPYVRY